MLQAWDCFKSVISVAEDAFGSGSLKQLDCEREFSILNGKLQLSRQFCYGCILIGGYASVSVLLRQLVKKTKLLIRIR